MKKLSEIEDTIIWNTPVKEEYTENITLNIKQSLLLKNNVNLLEFFLLREIDKVNNKETTSAKYFYEQFPALFRNRRQVKSILDLLSEDEYLTKTEDRYISGQITVAYALTKLGHQVISDKVYKPKYTLEEYMKSVQIINHWNSFKEMSTHSIKNYGDIQSKTIEKIIYYISGLLKGNPDWWDSEEKFTLNEILSIIDQYTLKWEKNYRPENKDVLPKSLKEFLLHFKSGKSEFFNIHQFGVYEIRTRIMDLKDIGISVPTLKLAYKVLSDNGTVKETEKLDIQENVYRTYKKYSIHREIVLDPVYAWNKNYQRIFVKFNTFVFEYLKFIESYCGIGNTKTGYLSFNRGNTILEQYVNYCIEKYNIYLFPSEKRKALIQKSKIVVDRK